MPKPVRYVLLYLLMLAAIVLAAWLIGYGTPGGSGG